MTVGWGEPHKPTDDDTVNWSPATERAIRERDARTFERDRARELAALLEERLALAEAVCRGVFGVIDAARARLAGRDASIDEAERVLWRAAGAWSRATGYGAPPGTTAADLEGVGDGTHPDRQA